MFKKLRRLIDKFNLVYSNDLLESFNSQDIEDLQEKMELLMDYFDIEFVEDELCEYCQEEGNGKGNGLYISKK